MVDIGFSDALSLAQTVGIVEIIGMGGALGIIGTMFIVLYFSRKQAGFQFGYRNKDS